MEEVYSCVAVNNWAIRFEQKLRGLCDQGGEGGTLLAVMQAVIYQVGRSPRACKWVQFRARSGLCLVLKIESGRVVVPALHPTHFLLVNAVFKPI